VICKKFSTSIEVTSNLGQHKLNLIYISLLAAKREEDSLPLKIGDGLKV
jgi:hypothetical protein